MTNGGGSSLGARRILRKGANAALFLGALFALAPARAEVLTILSDVGLDTEQLYVEPQGGSAALLNSAFPGGAPEGRNSMRTSITGGWSWNGYFYNATRDLSSYSGGTLRFWIKAPSRDVDIKMQSLSQGDISIAPLINRPEWNNPSPDGWVYFQLPLPTLPSDIRSPFMITYVGNGEYYLDHVRLVSPGTASPSFNVSLVPRPGKPGGSVLTWSGLTLPAGWVTADQAIQIDADPGALRTWGVQIYTDNMAQDANPKFFWSIGTAHPNPAGLIDSITTTRVLPMCWRVVDESTPTVDSIVEGSDFRLYSGELGGQASGFACYQRMKDLRTRTNPQEGTVAFAPGEDFVTVWDQEGMHFAEGDRSLFQGNYWGQIWGAARTPVLVYIGANFSQAVTTNVPPYRTFQTSKLMVEFFTE